MYGRAKAILLCQWPEKDAQLVPCTNEKAKLSLVEVSRMFAVTSGSFRSGSHPVIVYCSVNESHKTSKFSYPHVHNDCIKKAPANKHPKPCFIAYD